MGLIVPKPYENYPPRWAEYRSASGLVHLCSAFTRAAEVNRFGARYRLAKSCEVRLSPALLSSDVFGQAHALMQDSGDADGISHGPVDDDVRADQVGQERRRKIVAAMADLRVVADRRQGVIKLVAIDLQLLRSPGLAGIAQDVDQILPGFRGAGVVAAYGRTPGSIGRPLRMASMALCAISFIVSGVYGIPSPRSS